ncbi:YbeD family protein [Neptunomonas sp.]|uniref:YbeD family protein n=1 Tax=Neptunomonas sp. TaxID=1971898 RepID=UPI00356595E9
MSQEKTLKAEPVTEVQPPKIEFPCPDYPIKVVGKKSDDFEEFVVEVMRVHVPDLDVSRITIRDSSKGTYRSVRMFITATGEDQLKSLHEELIASDRVHIVI